MARGTLNELPLVVAAFDFEFMGGSMGSVVGERFVHAVEASIEGDIPMVCFSASGGARMQEAMYSLMQMAKTTAAVNMLNAARASIYFSADRSDNGWRIGKSGYARGHYHRRTKGVDRICRPARN